MKLLQKLTAAAIICLTAVSCTKKGPDIMPSDPVAFQNASATYYGSTENNAAYFTMDLTDGGKKLHLEFYGDPVDDHGTPTLKTGNYTLATGTATEAGTYIPGSSDSGCVYSETNGADVKSHNIIGGVFAITLSGTTYNVTIGLKDQNDYDIMGSYTGPITVEDTRDPVIDFASGFAQFYGKAINNDTHLFWVGLNSDGIVLDTSLGAYTGTGYYVRLCVITGTDVYTEIPDGTYVVDTSATPGSVLIDSDNTFFAEMVNDDITSAKSIISGTVTFRKTGDIYDVIMDIGDEDGNNYNKYYRGELKYSNYSGGFLEDTDLGTFAWGQMYYYGKTDSNANNFAVLLLGDGVGLDAEGYFTGSGYAMVMDMYTERVSGTDIPPATYSVDDTANPGTISEGYFFLAWDLGSYIYELVDGVAVNTIYIKGGTTTVSGANPNYDFKMAFVDPSGFNIAASYNGSLEYFDESSDSIVLPESSPDNRYQFNSIRVTNYKDYYKTGTTNLGMTFNADELSLYMDVITLDIGDESTVAPAGTYTFDTSKLANTFCEYSRINYQDFTFYPEGGTMTITDLNDIGDRTYTFDLDMGEKGMFYGEYEFSAFEDIELTEFNGGFINFFGSEFSDGMSNDFYTSIYGPGVTETGGYFQGTGYIITMDLYADLAATAEIPDGVYNVTNSYEPGNILISSTDTRYFEITDGGTSVIRTLKSGSVTVSKSGNTYTFDMAFVDQYGKSITGKFIGELSYFNQTAFPGSWNYVEVPSAKAPARKMIISKPDMAKPDGTGAQPANTLSKEVKKRDLIKPRKPDENNRFSKRP